MTTENNTQDETKVVDTNISKIYVGNLPFKTRNAGLAELFSNAGVKVTKANVVTKRHGQSSGFGFVQIEKEDEEKAIALNGTEIEQRAIKVEIATSLGSPKKRPRKKQTRKPRTEEGTAGETTPGENTTEPRTTATGEKKKRTKRRKPRKTAEPKEGETDSATPTGEAKPARAKRAPKPKVARPPRSTEPKEISDDVVYVANIPFAVKDDELFEFFKDVGAVSAKIVFSFRSKGFGFVTVDSQENQTKAVETKNGAEMAGRKLVVKRAYVRVEPEVTAETTTTTATETSA